MKKQILKIIGVLVFLIPLISCSADQKPMTVFLVRHGEKVDNSKDPDLSIAGHERASKLANILKDAEIEYIHSTNYIRTRDTATPSATVHGLDVKLYDPQDLPALVKKLRMTGSRHLVVGHSNTTPAMVKLLGGNPGSEINEESEYDRLYIVTIAGDGTANSIMIRYGNAHVPKLNQ